MNATAETKRPRATTDWKVTVEIVAEKPTPQRRDAWERFWNSVLRPIIEAESP